LNYIDRGQGVPVVLVHGTLGDYRTWEGQIDPFSQEYRVISYSRRYHYPNDWPANDSTFSVVVHAKDLAAFIQTLDVGPVHLVGHSFGAFISLLVARDQPKLVRSLTLVEPPVWSLLATSPEGAALLRDFNPASGVAEAFQTGDDEKAVRQFIDNVMGSSDAFENLAPNVQASMMQNARELKGEVTDANLFPPFTCEDAGDVRVPTLLLNGEASPEIFVRVQDLLEDCLPNRERAILPAASHGLEYENPQSFNAVVLEFLARH
jgi:pimeloyl-ACP methyl ester carboxylesterase